MFSLITKHQKQLRSIQKVTRLKSLNHNNYKYILSYNLFSTQFQKPKIRNRPKRERGRNKLNDSNTEDDDDIFTWIGNNAYDWCKRLLIFNVKFLGAGICFAQMYTAYEYFRYGKIKWVKRVLWWLPVRLT